MPTLPFQPEWIEVLKARFPKALERVWEVTDPMPDRPGLHRENVFDFESGMRLLISRDKLTFEEPEIHISASWENDLPFTVEEATRRVTDGYRALGGKGIVSFLGQSSRGIPHWLVVKES